MRSFLIRILQALVLLAVASSFAHADNFMYFKKKAPAGGGTSWSKIAESTAIIDNVTSGGQSVDLPGPPATGDLVVFAIAADVASANSVLSSGWTVPENSPLGGNPGSILAYKVMGGTPDSAVSISTSPTSAKAMVIQTWRGVDTSTPLDSALVAATGTSANPDCPSITTANNNALVFAVQYLDDDNSTVSTWPTGYTNQIEKNTGTVSDPQFATVAVASKIVASAGAEDPAAFTMSSADTWQAVTISFKKAP